MKILIRNVCVCVCGPGLKVLASCTHTHTERYDERTARVLRRVLLPGQFCANVKVAVLAGGATPRMINIV